MCVNHTQQICECSGKFPENLLMMFGLFMLIWTLLAICCSIPKVNKYITKFLEFLTFWPSMLYDWSVSRRMNKKMKNIVNEDPDEKYIKIFDPANNVFIYYNNDNFFQKINNKFLKIPFDSEILNLHKLKPGRSLFIWKRDEIFSKDDYNYEYM